ncbi:uncharacterized protein PGTG_11181 [Puccinia graminis f. sp. tritici CRL 75-36-700-3]|uniref:Cyanovirin-N domain-containing protein n=1 Tax=Puccinia graminis f. sp. tritici (strain CRL 75-36-700-3 / race SCCL) TaxID=418459 RepID=E3KL37_PUCGT|nr:uncharacterized protein PGTG_11181 [Puccinia graminis f. sp. tritici CRL 75-36-700-3]EFP85012.1 hypothetical protein PGTG_11181 [Puccinia graminis f. sp. tritici CRL 75-36-700-3]
MAPFNWSINATLMAAILLIFLSSPIQAANVERRQGQDQCNPANDHLTIHDCAVYVISSFFVRANDRTADFPTYPVIVDCRGGTDVSAGRLLDRNGNDGFERLQEMCTKNGQAGQLFVRGDCQIRTEKS